MHESDAAQLLVALYRACQIKSRTHGLGARAALTMAPAGRHLHRNSERRRQVYRKNLIYLSAASGGGAASAQLGAPEREFVRERK